MGFRWEMHIENGPSLCVGCQLRWGKELQVFPSFLGMFIKLLYLLSLSVIMEMLAFI